MHLDDLLGTDRAAGLRRAFLGAINDAYTENCGRYSDELGDNALTFAVAVVHNLRHMLEHALEFATGIKITRPRNSFQIEIDARWAVHFYKGGSSGGDIGEIRFDQSRTKLELVSANADQLALVFDEGDSAPTARDVRHLVVVHVGNAEDGLTGAWLGAPVLSPVNGFQWLWLDRLDASPVVDVSLPVAEEAPVWFDAAALPELIVELREPGIEADAANNTP
jgi:hypothetical protein